MRLTVAGICTPTFSATASQHPGFRGRKGHFVTSPCSPSIPKLRSGSISLRLSASRGLCAARGFSISGTNDVLLSSQEVVGICDTCSEHIAGRSVDVSSGESTRLLAGSSNFNSAATIFQFHKCVRCNFVISMHVFIHLVAKLAFKHHFIHLASANLIVQTLSLIHISEPTRPEPI
eukprot:5855422-Pyramimonas_sp.AAC.2